MKRRRILTGIMIVTAAVLVYFQMISGRMIVLEHKILINASTEKVWSVLNDTEAVEHYNPQVVNASCDSDIKQGVNTSRICTLNDNSEIKERIIAIEENEAISMELYESSWPVKNMKWRTAITPDNSGTLVTQKLEYQMKYGAFGAMLNSLMLKRKMNTSIQGVFESMKKYIESNH